MNNSCKVSENEKSQFITFVDITAFATRWKFIKISEFICFDFLATEFENNLNRDYFSFNLLFFAS